MQLNQYAVDSSALKAYTSNIVEQEKCNVRELVRIGFSLDPGSLPRAC